MVDVKQIRKILTERGVKQRELVTALTNMGYRTTEWEISRLQTHLEPGGLVEAVLAWVSRLGQPAGDGANAGRWMAVDDAARAWGQALPEILKRVELGQVQSAKMDVAGTEVVMVWSADSEDGAEDVW